MVIGEVISNVFDRAAQIIGMSTQARNAHSGLYTDDYNYRENNDSIKTAMAMGTALILLALVAYFLFYKN